jgi:NhaP-type Na+/H+ or K+/H+ antiporter
MKKQSSSLGSLFRELLWHCLMGITLGVICGGLLLQIGASQPDALMHGADTMAARLCLLLTVALLFGVGATLTGATFLANEKERSQSR